MPMASLNVAEWSADQVADWLSGTLSGGERSVCGGHERVSHGCCRRAGPDGGALRAGAARARPGRRQAADAALRRPRVPRHARHRPPGAAAGGRRTSAQLCECPAAVNIAHIDIHCVQ